MTILEASQTHTEITLSTQKRRKLANESFKISYDSRCVKIILCLYVFETIQSLSAVTACLAVLFQ